MIQALVRIASLIFGLIFLADTLAPLRTENLHVDLHETSVVPDSDGHGTEKKYELQFVGGTLDSCSVGYSAFQKLHDGDSVVAESTRLMHKCVRITRSAEPIWASKYWRLFAGLFGVCLVGVAIGKLRLDADGRITLYSSRRD